MWGSMALRPAQGRALPSKSLHHDLPAALKLYSDEPLGTRLFVQLRRCLSPVQSIAEKVPGSGSVLDIGCGHGLISLALACAQAKRRILGIDPSSAKLDIAARAGKKLPNVEFRRSSAEDVHDEKFDVILLIDVLYLLPYERKLALLRRCRNLLSPDGTLIVKASDTHPAWKYAVTYAQEKFMTGAELTLGHCGLHFLSCRQNNALLHHAGFVTEMHHLRHWTPYPHVFFVARQRAEL
jgi:2-polyprenyl-3-methyl-5-hydroxy-6-metoxy-1,4-benzoquinol methylase